MHQSNYRIVARITILLTMFVSFSPVAIATATPEFSVPFTWSKNGHVMVDAAINDSWKISMAVGRRAQFGELASSAIKTLGIKPENIELQHAMTATVFTELNALNEKMRKTTPWDNVSFIKINLCSLVPFSYAIIARIRS